MTEVMTIQEMEDLKWEVMQENTLQAALYALYLQDCIDQCMTQSYNLMFEYLNDGEDCTDTGVQNVE